jgi:quinoprotein glucose dehydrogenase
MHRLYLNEWFAAFLVCGLVLVSFSGQSAELGGGELAVPNADAQLAIKKFQVAEGLKVDLVAQEPQLMNPVAFDVDNRGRFFISETGRYRSSALDIRHYMDWYLDDLACRTVEDRVTMIKKHMGEDYVNMGKESELIRLVEDLDSDGKADSSKIYADGFNDLLDGIASGVLARGDDVYFTSIPSVWKLKDEDGDGKADTRESLSRGYGVHFSLTGHDLHGMIFGPDGKLYFTVGDRGAHVTSKEGEVFAFPDEGVCFRCDPDGSNLEVVARGLRNPQELAFDNYGNLFTGDNDCDHGDRERLVHIVEGGDSGWRIGYQFSEQNPAGAWNAEKLWHTRWEGQAAYLLPPLAHIDNGPSGFAFYPGVGLTEEYKDHFFLCHFKGQASVSGIKTFSLKPSGASYEMVNERILAWNILPTDVEFGPDGSLYWSDWVHGWPKSNMGRIYKLTPETSADQALANQTKLLFLDGMKNRSTAELTELLAHADQRIRLDAQYELAERGVSVIRDLSLILRHSSHQLQRIHCIWALDQIASNAKQNANVGSYIIPYLMDQDPEIRAQAAKALDQGWANDDSLPRLLKPLLKDESLRVRFFAAQSLGKLGHADAASWILEMIEENADRDLYLRHAGVTALARIGNHSAMVQAASHDSVAVRMAVLLAWRQTGETSIARFLTDSEPLIVVEAARAINDAPIESAMSALAELSSGLSPESLKSTLAPDADLVTPTLRRVINANFRLGNKVHAQLLTAFALNETMPVSIRAEGLQLLGEWGDPSPRDKVTGLYRPVAKRSEQSAITALQSHIETLLSHSETMIAESAAQAMGRLKHLESASLLATIVGDLSKSEGLRVEALRALALMEAPQLTEALVSVKHDFNVKLRREATRIQASSDPLTAAPQLNAVLENGTITEQQTALSSLGSIPGSVADEIILRWLGKWTKGEAPVEIGLDIIEAAEARQDGRIVEALLEWREALAESDSGNEEQLLLAGGDVELGENLFREHPAAACTRCHQLDGVGGDVGPRMDGIGSQQTAEYLLESIVKPNASIAEGFESVLVETKEGDYYAGVLKSESEEELVINSPEKGLIKVKTADVISREKGLSGMPEGMDRMLSKQDLRNLIAFLRAQKEDVSH